MQLLLLLLVALVIVKGSRYHENRQLPNVPLRNPAEATAEHWVNDAQDTLEKLEDIYRSRERGGFARNVVLFLGDGMSVPTVTAARILKAQRRGESGEESNLFFDKFPTVGLAKTYCVDAQVPDSACTATAYFCGVKANVGTLGLTAAVPRFDCTSSTNKSHHVESIAAWALADGRDVGLITTTRVTHSSPAGMYAKVADRNWENDASVRNAGHDINLCPDIAQQLVHMYPGNKFKVLFGGGRRELLPNTTRDEEGTQGRRADGRNLIQEWQDDKAALNVTYKYVWNKDELLQLKDSPPEYLLGLFDGGSMPFNLEADHAIKPTIAELTEVAIKALSRNKKGFFLFVEAGTLDFAHHDNNPLIALDETIEMDAAVQVAAELLSDDSLIIVTSDHTHVMSINGYSPRGHDILGLSNDVDRDGVPYMTLSYTNGPGARPHINGIRRDISKEEDFRALRWRTHADAPLVEDTHGGDDVPVYARGPHHMIFSGVYEQSHLPHRMAYAACIGPGRHVCNSSSYVQPSYLIFLLLTVVNLRIIYLH